MSVGHLKQATYSRLVSAGAGVAISAGALAPGGVETHVRILSLVLRQAGSEVRIYGTGCRWQATTVRQLRLAGVRFCIPPRLIRSVRQLGGVWSALRWRLSPLKGVQTVYAIGTGRSHALLKKSASEDTFSIYHEIIIPSGSQSPPAELLRMMEAAVANSSLVAKEMAAICPEKSIRVIPFLTAENATRPPTTRRAVESRPLQVGYMGRLEQRKRTDVLVHEWARMTARPPLAPAVLHLHGSDEGDGMRRELESYVKANRLGDRVQFHGGYSHASLPELLEKLDLVVLPSEWEGLPLVLVEAMQQGVPFVATAAGGTAELGQENPDVLVTGTEWESFEAGLTEMAARLRVGGVDSVRLHGWVEPRYGYEKVARQWEAALLESRAFFGLEKC